jgi:hypothetical protein
MVIPTWKEVSFQPRERFRCVMTIPVLHTVASKGHACLSWCNHQVQ